MSTSGLNMRTLGACFLILAATILSGCGASVGDLKGVVSYKNKPLASGMVTIATTDGGFQSPIGTDGSYSFKAVPCGPIKIAVVCRDEEKLLEFVKAMSQGARGKGNAPNTAPEVFSLIPEIYGDIENSGLQTVINGGKNVFNLDLKDKE